MRNALKCVRPPYSSMRKPPRNRREHDAPARLLPADPCDLDAFLGRFQLPAGVFTQKRQVDDYGQRRPFQRAVPGCRASAPVSSRISRASASITLSPGSASPPGNSQPRRGERTSSTSLPRRANPAAETICAGSRIYSSVSVSSTNPSSSPRSISRFESGSDSACTPESLR